FAQHTPKTGQPYFWDHLYHVAKPFQGTELFVPALCHDVLEDTTVTFDELAVRIGARDARIVHDLTKQPDEPYEMYIMRLSQVASDDTLRIKFSDLLQNLRGDRLRRLDGPTTERLLAKYADAIRMLTWTPRRAALFTDLAFEINPTAMLVFYPS